MKIESINISRLIVPFHQPLKVAIGERCGAENVIVHITTEEGVSGWGEASSAPYITGDSVGTNHQTAQALAKLIKGKDALAIEARMAEINAYTVSGPSIRAAFDFALHDIAAQAADMPLYRFLGGEKRELRTDLTIGWQSTVEETVAQAKAILAAGFDAIKMKVGRPGLEDVAHVQAVRDLVGPDIAIKIDSNQGWDLPTAIANIEAMKDLDLQYSEQPLAHWDIDNLARLKEKVSLPICADESVFDHRDAFKEDPVIGLILFGSRPCMSAAMRLYGVGSKRWQIGSHLPLKEWKQVVKGRWSRQMLRW